MHVNLRAVFTFESQIAIPCGQNILSDSLETRKGLICDSIRHHSKVSLNNRGSSSWIKLYLRIFVMWFYYRISSFCTRLFSAIWKMSVIKCFYHDQSPEPFDYLFFFFAFLKDIVIFHFIILSILCTVPFRRTWQDQLSTNKK